MEPKYFADEVIGHPNHPLTFGDRMPRDLFVQNASRVEIYCMPYLAIRCQLKRVPIESHLYIYIFKYDTV